MQAANLFHAWAAMLRKRDTKRVRYATTLHGYRGEGDELTVIEMVHYRTPIVWSNRETFRLNVVPTVTTMRRIRALRAYGWDFYRRNGLMHYVKPDGETVVFRRSIHVRYADGAVLRHDGPAPWENAGGQRDLRRALAASFDAWTQNPKKGCPFCGRWAVSQAVEAKRGVELWNLLTTPEGVPSACLWHTAVLHPHSADVHNVKALLPHVPFKRRKTFLRRHRSAFLRAAAGHYNAALGSSA
jgi:hypothetical protein